MNESSESLALVMTASQSTARPTLRETSDVFTGFCVTQGFRARTLDAKGRVPLEHALKQNISQLTLLLNPNSCLTADGMCRRRLDDDV